MRTVSSPTPVDPVLVCGLPGSGYVGKLAADYLVSTFKARKVAEFFASSFPPHVNIDEDGVATRLSAELYHAETGQSNDLLVFTADAQPSTFEGEYELSESVLLEAKKLKTKQVFTLAAYITGSFVRSRRVFAAVTDRESLARLSGSGVQVMKEGGISGMNGVIVGMAKLHGLMGASLLGETSGFLLDPAASYAVLEALSKILGIEVDLASIEERAKEAQQIFGQVRRLSGQSVEEAGHTKEEGRPGYIA